MKQYQFNTFGKKIIPTEVPIPIPKDNEIIIKTLFCGVCHSDVHLHEGFFDLGQDQKLEIPAQLPVVMGHEVLGEVVRVGKKVTGVKLRKKYVVYPWIGCGDCISCLNGDEHYCMLPNNIGINVSGGYAEYISVPNKKYLFEKQYRKRYVDRLDQFCPAVPRPFFRK